MPRYNLLRWKVKRDRERKRAIDNLIRLRKRLDLSIPAKDADDNLLLATWNVRDFGKPVRKRRGWGGRLPETWFYIAEVISRFDFVAVQEVNELPEWHEVMDILGPNWDFIATDETDPALGGNGERMTFVYDKRKVWFQNVAGEIVLPPSYLISPSEFEVQGKKVVAGNQFKRTPYIASFQSGWMKFDICIVHLYYGANYGEKLQHRIEEIDTIAEYLGNRADRALGDDRALILLGDFNIVSPRHRTMEALLAHDFVVPDPLREKPTTGTAKHYDQIAFKTKPEVVEYVNRPGAGPLESNAGVFPLFEAVFTDEQFEEYSDAVKGLSRGRRAADQAELLDVYRDWRTYQFSDHYPMWVRLQSDRSAEYLERLRAQLEDQ